MGNPVLDLNNPDKWDLAHSDTIIAGVRQGVEYYPIVPFTLPYLFTSPFLLVSAENLDARPWWYLGCRLQQIVQVGIAGSDAHSKFVKVPVNRRKLCQLDAVAAQYTIKIEIPYWYSKMKLSIWEYNAPVQDTTEQAVKEQADIIRIDLVRLEHKIDLINQ